MPEVYISLGSNIGDRETNLSEARNYISIKIGPITKASSIFETSPWGFQSETLFFNQVIGVETNQHPREILYTLKLIEQKLGRTIKKTFSGYNSRIIDLDILFYDNQIWNDHDLRIPHPLLAERLFVLIPLKEIAPDKIHPLLHINISQLLSLCDDTGSVKKIN